MDRTLLIAMLCTAIATTAYAGEVDIVNARAHNSGGGHYRFDVTLRHSDTGWDHYADAWQVLAPDGSLLGERILYHPHEQEQPFTRSLSGVAIPPGTGYVMIRAHDKVHGYSNRQFRLDLP